MKDLKCGLRDCKYNKGYSCVAKKIGVDQHTDCTSYAPSEQKRKAIFESAEDFAPANYSVDTSIDCTAKCLFNKDNKCIANGITIMMGEEDNKAMCMSFIKD
ncbi:MAG: DUF1540 domain-containing protein [Firmicutes bacterium]|nr:DUF1540 domain-containing protein [Bacillota bacterium]MCL1954112.1 DUF1540 domain-containing protein [Bacillota bacterium]